MKTTKLILCALVLAAFANQADAAVRVCSGYPWPRHAPQEVVRGWFSFFHWVRP